MRLMSFTLTTEQVRSRTKTVTRRIGWVDLQPGTLMQPVEKAQGLKRGEQVRRIGDPISVVSVRRERLDTITRDDVVREGFSQFSSHAFVRMFCRHNKCLPSTVVTRIEFTYGAPA